MDFPEIRMSENPYLKANPISKILFFWVIPFFSRANQKPLVITDIPQVLQEDKATVLGDRLEQYWDEELQRNKLHNKNPSLLRALFKMTWKPLLLATVVGALNQCVVVVIQSIVLRHLISSFVAINKQVCWYESGYFYAAEICLVAFLNLFTYHSSAFLGLHGGMKLGVALTSLVYRKCLCLSKSAQQETNTGQIVNILSNDCARMDVALCYAPHFLTCPAQFGIIVFILWMNISYVGVAAGAFVLLLVIFQLYFTIKFSTMFGKHLAEWTDERGRIMKEIVGGMRVIKMYAWENCFANVISRIRSSEVDQLKKRSMLYGMQNVLSMIIPKFTQCFTFLLIVLWQKEPMTADIVFFTLSYLHVVVESMVDFVPVTAAVASETVVGIKRIQNFLLLNEHRNSHNSHIIKTEQVQVPTLVGIRMRELCAKWENSSSTLNQLSLNIQGNQLVLVVGPVGSGKTSLLHTILDELPAMSGSVVVTGNVSYASQESWLFSGSVKQNILFGVPFNSNKYNKILNTCALTEDISQWPNGDMSVVGERGVILSGGQKSRVNLARCLYRDADIYLLDDPLSAVDTRVGRHIFEKCVKGLLRDKCRILVTHQLQYLPEADHIVVLNDGQIVAQGTYTELVTTGIDFVTLVSSKHSYVDTNQDNIINSLGQNEQNFKYEDELELEATGTKRVSAKTYWKYVTSGNSRVTLACLLVTCILSHIAVSTTDLWLSFWSNSVPVLNCTGVTNGTCSTVNFDNSFYIYIYCSLVVSVTVLGFISCLWDYQFMVKNSVSIHNKMFNSLIRAPVKFFDENTTGKILNRFTKDVVSMDQQLPTVLVDTFYIAINVIGVICLVIYSNHYLAVPTLFIIVVWYYIREYFIKTARDLKRIECAGKTPIFTQVAATMQGLTTIRASKCEAVLTQQFERNQDVHTGSRFLLLASFRCLGTSLELVSNIFLVVVTFSFFVLSTSKEGGNVGLAIASLISMTGMFQYGMKQSAETESCMTSVQRALEYAELKSEANLYSNQDELLPKEWPSQGQLEFTNVYLSYNEDVPVLKNLTFKIEPSEKIGVVGRTGAGKSSIVAALLRLTEPQGNVMIDNVPIAKIGLHDLRKSISIIPQDPVLFSGSVRHNLDPFGEFDDATLWTVIEQVELRNAMHSLDQIVADGGVNFSVGQRQLVCLARAILRQNKILVMDEATANVDPKTDSLIQATIKSKFASSTVIIIAHRLHTVLDCDKILVMNRGEIMEFDHPQVLLKRKFSVFSEMLAQTGEISGNPISISNE